MLFVEQGDLSRKLTPMLVDKKEEEVYQFATVAVNVSKSPGLTTAGLATSETMRGYTATQLGGPVVGGPDGADWPSTRRALGNVEYVVENGSYMCKPRV